MKIFKNLKYIVCVFLIFFFVKPAVAQLGQLDDVNPGFIMVADQGQLTDTLSLWGDVGRSGRYIIPRGTTPLELISFGGGFGTRGNMNNNAFAKIRLRVSISRYNEQEDREIVKHFSFKHSDPIPNGLREYPLNSEDVVTIQVKRKPSFIDIVGVVGPILSTITTSYFIYNEIIK